MADTMESHSSTAEFLSRCWVPIIHLESRFMFAYGNTSMEDFMEDLQVSDAMDILMLGVGDIRYMLKTVAGLETRPHTAGCPHSLGYHSVDTFLSVSTSSSFSDYLVFIPVFCIKVKVKVCHLYSASS